MVELEKVVTVVGVEKVTAVLSTTSTPGCQPLNIIVAESMETPAVGVIF